MQLIRQHLAQKAKDQAAADTPDETPAPSPEPVAEEPLRVAR